MFYVNYISIKLKEKFKKKYTDKRAPASKTSSVVATFCRSEIMLEDAAMELRSLFLKRIIRLHGKGQVVILKSQQQKFGTIFTKIHRNSVVIRIF